MPGSPRQPEFTWTDGWVFLSVLLAEDGRLSFIIAAGDGINHAIFTTEELGPSLSKLVTVGLIERQEDRFLATKTARDAYEVVSKKSRHLFDTAENLARWLQEEFEPPDVLNDVPGPATTRDDISKAYRNYIKGLFRRRASSRKMENR